MNHDPLRVPIVAIAFSADARAEKTFQVARRMDPHALCAAIVDEAQASLLRNLCEHQAAAPLLILRSENQSARELAQDLISLKAKHPIAVLVASVPPDRRLSRFWRRNAGREWLHQLSALGRDVQVLQFDPAWQSSPPRIR